MPTVITCSGCKALCPHDTPHKSSFRRFCKAKCKAAWLDKYSKALAAKRTAYVQRPYTKATVKLRDRLPKAEPVKVVEAPTDWREWQWWERREFLLLTGSKHLGAG